MLDTVLNAVIATLEAQGLRSFRDYPEREADLQSGACVCIGVESCRCVSAGMGEYLGVKAGLGGSEDAELYGRRLELVFCFEVFSPFGESFGAAGCRDCADKLRRCFDLLPSGIRILELDSGEVFADEELLAFRLKCKLRCTAFLVAEGEGGEGEFLNFLLKGTVKNGY